MDDTKDIAPARVASRRAILAAAVGGLGAWVAGALTHVSRAEAANFDVVNVGDDLTGSLTTKFTVDTAGYSALWGNATGGGTSAGVRGDSASGVYGSAGVLGNGNSTGVAGFGQSVGVRGEGFTGVAGKGTVYGRGVSGYSAQGYGVYADTDSGYGVYAKGQSAGYGVYADTNAVDRPAIAGVSKGGSSGVVGSVGALVAPKPNTGVYGNGSTLDTSRGVWGVATIGQGVRGEATTGVGVAGVASSNNGYAFRGSGRVRFDKVSGVATIPAGATSVTVTPGVDVTSDSFVLLTAKANIGSRSVYYSTDATNNRITIRLSSSRPSSTPVAWLLMR